MEILSPEILRLALHTAVILAVLSLVLLGVIIAVRWQAERTAQRTAAFRHRTEPIIAAYLRDDGEPAPVVEALRDDPARALDLLMEISAGLEPSARGPLCALFAALPLRARETAALHSRRWPRRKQAAERLGYLGDGVAVDALLEVLRDPVLEVRVAAARSLAAHGEARAIEPVILAFDLPGAMNQRRVADVISGFGPAAVDPLLDILANRGGHYSNNALGVAVRALGLLRARTAGAALTELLRNPEFRLRLNAVRSLGLIGDRTAADAVARLVGDREWEVRNVVMRTLGQLKATQHLEELTAGLRDESWWVRFSAAQALWQLGQPGREALTTAMTRSPDRYARDMSRQILEEHGALANANIQPS
jgi:hypothetical protein